jgi:hydrogenase maturation protease
MTGKTLVLGLGNDLYGDDGVGVEVVRRLREEITGASADAPFCDPERTVFEECSLTGLALLDVITGYDRLVLVDTIKRPQPLTGRVSILRGEDLRAIPGPSPHYVSVPQTIEIGRRVGLRVPSDIVVVAVEARDMHRLGEGLTEEMSRALPAIAALVKDVLRKGLRAAGGNRSPEKDLRRPPRRFPAGAGAEASKGMTSRFGAKLPPKVSVGKKSTGAGRRSRGRRP